jgi:hypothetical protein
MPPPRERNFRRAAGLPIPRRAETLRVLRPAAADNGIRQTDAARNVSIGVVPNVRRRRERAPRGSDADGRAAREAARASLRLLLWSSTPESEADLPRLRRTLRTAAVTRAHATGYAIGERAASALVAWLEAAALAISEVARLLRANGTGGPNNADKRDD